MDGLKVLFHGALVLLDGYADRLDVKRCDKLGPNIYQIEGNLYNRDGSPRPGNPQAPAIATIYSYQQAKRDGLIEPAAGYHLEPGPGYRPEYDFAERYTKKVP